MGKNVAVFVDVANIFYAAKSAGVDIDYVTLLKAAIAGRDFVRAYAYTGLDPDNENQRNFHSFLSRHGYKVVSKDIRKYGDGKVKANLDIELVVDMLKTARNLDVAIVVSGDGDFAPAIRAVQEMGVRVEVISFRGNTSSDLIDVADIFTDITQLAKVERGSSRSGRRVAADDEFDLSMTEVPDKQTEGSGTRGRRGRTRTHAPEAAEPVAPARPVRRSPRATPAEPVTAAGPITVLPGERLSRVAAQQVGADPVAANDDEAFEPSDEAGGPTPELTADGEPRRRRRRGGRGRGRGRGRADEMVADQPDDRPAGDTAREPVRDAAREPVREAPREPVRDAAKDAARAARDAAREAREAAREIADDAAPARGPRPTPFGSVWDSQLGVPKAPAAGLGPLPVDEDEEEPEIPEYLLAERRRGGQPPMGRGRGQAPVGRGVRSGYAAAVDRERYGRGGVSRYSEPQRPPQSQPSRPPQRRDERPPQQQVRPERPPRSEEPWSEVPPEIEEMLRAQMAARVGRGPERGPERQPERGGSRAPASPTESTVPSTAEGPAPIPSASSEPGSSAAAPRGRRPRVAAEPGPDAAAAVPDEAALLPEPVRPRGGRRRAGTPSEADRAGTSAVSRAAKEASDAATDAPTAAEPAPAGRRRRSSAAAGEGEDSAGALTSTAASGSRSRARPTPAGEAGSSTAGASTGARRGRPPRAASTADDADGPAATPRPKRATGAAAAKKAAGTSSGAAGSEPGEAPAAAPRRRSTRGASEPA